MHVSCRCRGSSEKCQKFLKLQTPHAYLEDQETGGKTNLQLWQRLIFIQISYLFTVLAGSWAVFRDITTRSLWRQEMPRCEEFKGSKRQPPSLYLTRCNQCPSRCSSNCHSGIHCIVLIVMARCDQRQTCLDHNLLWPRSTRKTECHTEQTRRRRSNQSVNCPIGTAAAGTCCGQSLSTTRKSGQASYSKRDRRWELPPRASGYLLKELSSLSKKTAAPLRHAECFRDAGGACFW